MLPLLQLLLLLATISPSWQVGNATLTYLTKAGCEALINDSSLCECQDQDIKCETLQVNSDSEKLYSISCHIFDARGFGYIPPLNVGKIGSLTIQNCAIPDAKSIPNLISQLGITNYTELEVFNFFDPKKTDRAEVLQQHYTNLPGLSKLTILGFKSTLPTNFFQNVFELKHLSLKGYSDLPATILHPLANLTKLNIVVKNIHKVASQIFAKQSKLKQLVIDCDVKNSSVEMSAFASDELWHMTELQSFELFNCGDNVPTDLFWKSEHLAYIGIRSNISYLHKDFLQAQKRLLTLRLERNNIARLPDQLFYYTPMLLEIHLAFNNLDRIQAGLFSKLKQLQVLNLEHNPITTIAPTAFNTLSSHIYVGQLYPKAETADWARSTNATICEEEYIYGVCIYCKRDEYIDHFADKENCNKPTLKAKEILAKKALEIQLNLSSTEHRKVPQEDYSED
ncbi:carboxypeptidase N subunit 2 [Drosophila obscura]|uniref:carboxypeptidase N subunit 2 n=1 Tax=Drosophila obscura TaxID=7282 RepID=UPI001BB0DA68|nr:carboxypeptidase N subunit 2 [Drosophila obscura]XP_041449680.1 carboxypeptidase N subunit 2 [Drosophila obscura]